ncbi:actin-binding Rho-activating protein isoform X1 [Halyomorpha halys]|uniref:actin-binding Rho-activating protein isoform X1 n=1 Tax=Halyomorpha halys TaxID=286706 RepID=UPI0006D4F44A|nr:actin-binding Rho-activating protein isoform X1 [Halyomorpha halys]
MPVGGSLNKFINKFNSEANKHQETQSNNPFSSSFSGGQRPRVSKEEYGRPKAGSKTEARGLQAKSHINKEILELCNIIYELALLNRNESDDENDIDDKNIVVTFGELFETYTTISNKVVGLLIQAKKKGLVYFEKEMLFQRRDDDELIVLLKPIKEINAIAKGNSQPTSCQDLEEQELT